MATVPIPDVPRGRRFLSAAWRDLVMLNYEIDPAVLRPRVPHGVELDPWGGRHFVSVVGFLFLGTRVLGVPVPFHRNFAEVNLRFYVRRRADKGWRRGVAFVKEVVPRRAIAAIARWVYNENYVACRMRSAVCRPGPAGAGSVAYHWRGPAGWNQVGASFEGTPALPASGSEEEFITEHYWGYVGQRDGSTLECDADFYGPPFTQELARPPSSAFVAEGSPIAVYRGDRLR